MIITASEVKPRLLDLFCGAGGAAVGYSRAGFDVTGVDIHTQPRFPFVFHRADALEFLEAHGREYDAIHASPPCQAYTSLRALWPEAHYPELIIPTLLLLERIGRPFILENVPGAGLQTHIVLCGSMFGLGADCGGVWRQIRRHRDFACSWYFLMPLRCRHSGRPVGVYGHGGGQSKLKGIKGKKDECSMAMGIDWMSRYELSQAIPPSYTEWIGWRLREHLAAPDAPFAARPSFGGGSTDA